MPSRNVMDRLRSGDLLLMDGGTGSEIQRRGAEVLIGASPEKGLQAWSATANVDFAHVVQQVHQDYIRCGADVIISNNFWTGPSRLEPIGLADRWEEFSRAAARNALKARDAMDPEAYVAGGIAAPTKQVRSGVEEGSDVQIMGEDAYKKEFADHAKLLAEEGVDLLLPEYVGYLDDCVAAVDACAEAGLPVWLGVRHITAEGGMQYGESLEDLGRALEGHPVDAVLLMCCLPESITAGIPILRRTYGGIIGAYPNIGYSPVAPLGKGSDPVYQEFEYTGDFLNLGGYTPSRLGEFSQEWKNLGAQIIGGCCATGPEHTLAQRDVVKAARPAAGVA